MIKVITGIRRCGKSSLMKLMAQPSNQPAPKRAAALKRISAAVQKNYVVEQNIGLEYCNQLFVWEEQFENLSPEERTKQRLKEEKPIFWPVRYSHI